MKRLAILAIAILAGCNDNNAEPGETINKNDWYEVVDIETGVVLRCRDVGQHSGHYTMYYPMCYVKPGG